MKKVLIIITGIVLLSCTNPSDAVTLLDCPCLIETVSLPSTNRGYRVTLIDKDENKVTFFTTVKHSVGDTIQ